jgi:hypothetical protein
MSAVMFISLRSINAIFNGVLPHDNGEVNFLAIVAIDKLRFTK